MKKNTKIILIIFISLIILSVAFLVLTLFNSSRSPEEVDTRRISDLRQINLALEMYYDDHKIYPKKLEELEAGDSPYITKVPVDRISSKSYDYGTNQDNKFYILKAVLDDKSRGALKNDMDGKIFGIDCNDPAYCIDENY